MKTKRAFIVVLAMFLAMSFVACAVNQFTPVQKSSMFMGFYNSQFYDYMRTMGYGMDVSGEWVQMSEPELTEEQREVLRERKKLLGEFYTLVMIYDGYVNKGLAPDRVTEEKIMDLLNKL